MQRKLKKLKEYLKKQKSVRLVYLFGSRATDKQSPLSDVDIAVYLDEKLNKKQRFRTQLKLIGDICSILKRNDVDVVVMNDASVFLNFEIIKHNKVLVNKDNEERVDREVKSMKYYLDRKAHLESLDIPFDNRDVWTYKN